MDSRKVLWAMTREDLRGDGVLLDMGGLRVGGRGLDFGHEELFQRLTNLLNGLYFSPSFSNAVNGRVGVFRVFDLKFGDVTGGGLDQGEREALMFQWG